jgi:hypothetical protein
MGLRQKTISRYCPFNISMLSHLGGHLWSVGHSCAHHEGGVVHMQLECVHIILIQVVHLGLHELFCQNCSLYHGTCDVYLHIGVI